MPGFTSYAKSAEDRLLTETVYCRKITGRLWLKIERFLAKAGGWFFCQIVRQQRQNRKNKHCVWLPIHRKEKRHMAKVKLMPGKNMKIMQHNKALKSMPGENKKTKQHSKALSTRSIAPWGLLPKKLQVWKCKESGSRPANARGIKTRHWLSPVVSVRTESWPTLMHTKWKWDAV